MKSGNAKEVEIFHLHGARNGVEMIVVDRIGSEILGKVERDGAVLLRSANPVVAHVGYDMAEIIGIAILGHLLTSSLRHPKFPNSQKVASETAALVSASWSWSLFSYSAGV